MPFFCGKGNSKGLEITSLAPFKSEKKFSLWFVFKTSERPELAPVLSVLMISDPPVP